MLVRVAGDARAGWERMLTAGPGGATLMVAADSAEQLDEMLAGLQDVRPVPPVRSYCSVSTLSLLLCSASPRVFFENT